MQKNLNQQGAIHLILLLLAGILISLTFKDNIMNLIMPKDQSYAAANEVFPYGVFDDSNKQTVTSFETTINDLKSKNLDSILFTNSANQFHMPLLDISDQLNFPVYFGGPMNELSSQWFNNPIEATQQNADNIIGPLVDQVKTHSSVKGYNLIDDTNISAAEKLKLAFNVYREHDPDRTVTATFVGGPHEKSHNISNPDTLLTYYYPAKLPKNACDWDFISPTHNAFSWSIRNISRTKNPSIPLWLILQSHGNSATTNPSAPADALRTPSPEEIKLQNWLAIGEGAKGIFWFTYSTQQFWVGLEDNPTLFNTIAEQASRTKPLAPALLKLEKTVDQFSVDGSANRYVSTLVDPSVGKYYVVAANASCDSNQQLSIISSTIQGQLKDLVPV